MAVVAMVCSSLCEEPVSSLQALGDCSRKGWRSCACGWADICSDALFAIRRCVAEDSEGEETLRSMRLVNRHWCRRISEWISVLTCPAGTSGVGGPQPRFPNVRCLNLTANGGNDLEECLDALSRALPGLRTLRLNGPERDTVRKTSHGVVYTCATKAETTAWEIPPGAAFSGTVFPSLAHLDLAGGWFRSGALLGAVPRLERLDLAGCRGICDRSLVGVSALPRLKWLGLAGCVNVTYFGLIILSGSTSLEALSLKDCAQIDDTSITALASLVSLTDLDLRVCPRVTGESLGALSHLSIRKLNLMCCSSLGDAGLVHLREFSALRTLDIRMCGGVTDRGMSEIQSLPSITELYIGGGQLTDAGMGYLSNLKSVTSLVMLNMPDITVASLKGLGGIEQLRRLEVYRCKNVSEKGVKCALGARSKPLALQVWC